MIDYETYCQIKQASQQQQLSVSQIAATLQRGKMRSRSSRARGLKPTSVLLELDLMPSRSSRACGLKR